jgi:hypothetical protein
VIVNFVIFFLKKEILLQYINKKKYIFIIVIKRKKFGKSFFKFDFFSGLQLAQNKRAKRQRKINRMLLLIHGRLA